MVTASEAEVSPLADIEVASGKDYGTPRRRGARPKCLAGKYRTDRVHASV